MKNKGIIRLTSWAFIILLAGCAVSRSQILTSPKGLILEEKKESQEMVYLAVPSAEIQKIKNDLFYTEQLAQELAYQFMYLLGIRSDQGRTPYQESWPKLIKKFKEDLKNISNLSTDPSGFVRVTFHTYQKTIRQYMLASTANLLTLSPAESLDIQLETGLQGLLNWSYIVELKPK